MNNPLISLVYISNRYGSLDVLKANMARQSIRDFELVFVDGLYSERKEEVKKHFDGYRVKHIDQNQLPIDGYLSRLARADNLAFKNCDGELIVCLQDYIYIEPYGLEKYYNIHKEHNGKALITGVGHQYKSPTAEDIFDPKGLITVFEFNYNKKPENKFWDDPRHNGSTEVRDAEPVEWELNWAAISKEAIYDLGGMDEEYDKIGFAYDNTNIAERARMLGYKILLDGSNECYGFDHDGWWPNPLKVHRISPIHYHFEQMYKMQRGELSPRLDYLKN
jgi:hypothetical protein